MAPLNKKKIVLNFPTFAGNLVLGLQERNEPLKAYNNLPAHPPNGGFDCMPTGLLDGCSAAA